MPSSIVHGILEVVFQPVFEFVGYIVGSIVVPVISLGRWRCDSLGDSVPRKRLRAAGLYHMRDGQVYLTVEATQFVGVLTAVLVVGTGVLLWYVSR